MKVAVIAGDEQWRELTAQQAAAGEEILRAEAPGNAGEATVCLDLLFDGSPERIRQLESLPAALVIIHSVEKTLAGLPSHFVRINAWPGFLGRPLAELAATDETSFRMAAEVLSLFGKQASRTPDIPGFITPRVVSMIINEAYLALEEGVSGKEEIDTAMKLGTNYPFGPFEWSGRIGLKNIHTLLLAMATDGGDRYRPAPLLAREAGLA